MRGRRKTVGEKGRCFADSHFVASAAVKMV